jgi:hypothetical protein
MRRAKVPGVATYPLTAEVTGQDICAVPQILCSGSTGSVTDAEVCLHSRDVSQTVAVPLFRHPALAL